MALNVYTEGMAEQISKIFFPHLETNILVVFTLFKACPSPQGPRPSPSKFLPPGGVPV